MPRRAANRQGNTPEDLRKVPWSVKLSANENAALLMVARVRGVLPQDLLRERSLNEVVKEYDRLVRQVAAAS